MTGRVRLVPSRYLPVLGGESRLDTSQIKARGDPSHDDTAVKRLRLFLFSYFKKARKHQ